MSNTLHTKTVDIYEHPTEFLNNQGTITIGDLHGNALKLLHFLILNVVVKFGEDGLDMYKEFAKIYHDHPRLMGDFKFDREWVDGEHFGDGYLKVEELLYEEFSSDKKDEIRAQLKAFNNLLGELEICEDAPLIRLIGDEMADRGANDYFTLKLLELLHKNGVETHINISNHSDTFISAYENKERFIPKWSIPGEQIPSVLRLQLLIDNNLVDKQEINHIVDTCYKPALRVIDYSLTEDSITLFTHAPVPYNVIKWTADVLEVAYNDSSVQELANTIDKINKIFQEEYVEKGTTQQLLNKEDGITNTIRNESIVHANVHVKNPLTSLMWNRLTARTDSDFKKIGIERKEKVKGFNVYYCHGHDSYNPSESYIFNLDTLCGKYPKESDFDKIEDSQTLLVLDSKHTIPSQELSSSKKPSVDEIHLEFHKQPEQILKVKELKELKELDKLDKLKEKIRNVVTAYTEHSHTWHGFFSLKHRHGRGGRKTAVNFRDVMMGKETFDEVILSALTHLTQEKGNLHEHSFKPMLLKILTEVTNECKKTDLTGDITSENFYRKVNKLAEAHDIALEESSTNTMQGN